ncbi:replication initiation protein RepM [Thiofilum flexile]|uniref:replication initiation protein RepM n=1 Tax=Thiofilum flexile TaxID=125627 RepID=UPI00037548FD|nr:replication initiation protein RepM [Thiofilum flexile]
MNDLVIKHNALINASYTLTLVEQRLILLGIVSARTSSTKITSDSVLEIHASQYINQFNVEKHSAYEALKVAATELFKREFNYQGTKEGKTKYVKSRWVSRIAYIDDLAQVEIVFAPDVIPLITELENRFTQYELEQVSKLSSSYAVRLYELLIAWRSTGKTPVTTLGDLRNRLGILNSEYIRMSDFKRRVLDLAIDQINEHTDITASYEQHKQGRVITGFSFTFKFKKPKKQKTSINTELETVDVPMTPEEAQAAQKRLMAAMPRELKEFDGFKRPSDLNPTSFENASKEAPVKEKKEITQEDLEQEFENLKAISDNDLGLLMKLASKELKEFLQKKLMS